MQASLTGKMCGLNVSEQVQKFFEGKKIYDEESFALLATDEKEVKTEIFELMKAGGFELKEPSEQIAIKKLWISWRRAIESTPGNNSAPAAARSSDELPAETAIDLKSQWAALHGYVLPEGHLLSASLQLKLWKAANSPSPLVEAVLMENLRLLCQKSKATVPLLNVVTLTTTKVEADSIYGPMEVYARARAWFLTMAYISVRRASWFDLQTATFASEKVFDLVQRTSGLSSPPISHFLIAWAGTVNHFAEQVRVTGGTLKETVLNTGMWEHKWNWSNPAPSAGNVGVDLPADVAMDVNEAKEQARLFQSMVDKRNYDNGNANRVTRSDTRKFNGKGGGKKGKKFIGDNNINFNKNGNGNNNFNKNGIGNNNNFNKDNRGDRGNDRRNDRARSRGVSRGRRS
jgi:hypothetical protein